MRAKVKFGVIATWVNAFGSEIVLLRSGHAWLHDANGWTMLQEYAGRSVDDIDRMLRGTPFVRGVSLRGMRELG